MNLFKKKRYWLSLLIVLILGGVAYMAYSYGASPTRIALVNFPGYQSSGIVLSNKDSHIKYDLYDEDEIDDYKNHDFILVFGMGLKWNETERQKLLELLDKGLPLQVVMATSPENNITNIDSVHAQRIIEYIDSGSKKNFQSLARYVRKYIDAKRFFVTDPEPPQPATSEVYFHIDENVAYEKKADIEAYMKKHGFWHEGGRKVLVIGGINDPFAGNKQNVDSLIMSLSRAGHNVYPVSSFMGRIDFMEEVNPDLVIYFPHGRLMMGMAERTVAYLKEHNIPMITPLTILQTKEEWEQDPMGMMGGFMSQTIVMPELDGAVYPYVFSTQEKNADGYYELKAIPNRLERLTSLVTRYMDLKHKPNKDKKLAIYFFKGPGQEALQAQGLETIPSLYNFLKRLQQEGYDLTGLPSDVESFRKQMMLQGQILKPYAKGSVDSFLQTASPVSVERSVLESWIKHDISPKLQEDIKSTYGDAPGEFMVYKEHGKEYLAIARLQYGNVALIPQPTAAIGGDTFAIAHGANMAPPYPYIGAYLWAHNAFGADAMIHFGTHGSLEFTPRKQVALSDTDWGDQLVAGLPHFYYYTIGNIGESMMAKRRSYAAVVSYLTPAFSESGTRGAYKELMSAIGRYYEIKETSAKERQSIEVKRLAVGMGLHRELRLDSTITKPYSATEIEKIDNFAEEIANEKITGKLYTTGEVYEPNRLNSTVIAMAADPIAYSKAKLDYLNNKVGKDYASNNRLFTQRYLAPAKSLVARYLSTTEIPTSVALSYAGITEETLENALDIVDPKKKMMQMMMAAMGNDKGESGKPAVNMPVIRGEKSKVKHPAWIPKVGKRPEHVDKMLKKAQAEPKKVDKDRPAEMLQKNQKAAIREMASVEVSAEEREHAIAIVELVEAIQNIHSYAEALRESPEEELDALVNALSGGYIAPSSGGDAVANPRAVPTGRNLYSINAESTPTERAWSRGVQLAENTLKQYKEKYGKYPTKVSYTFWSSEFIESQGTTIAQVLYMIGVEPIRDSFGRVTDIRLIPVKELGRPRIDVVIQTSGQFRDLAASRLDLLNRAIIMASEAKDKGYDNYVASGTANSEKALVEAGMTPKDARELSTSRIFGGINGMYGTGIQEMVTAGDKWENTDEIAEVYLNNMGASYTGQKDWGHFTKHLFRVALANTDVVIQPRQSNTWGALSLDHVYEFMGGLNLTIRSVTGKDPEAYFADYRNRNNARIQDLKEAIGVESRATILNPVYVKDVMAGGASSLGRITEVVTNTYGWEVSKPEVIDDALWNEIYNVYIEDSFKFGVKARFEEISPVALQEITAVMLETVRKGLWKASPEQVAKLSSVHIELTNKYGATGGGMASSNKKLQNFIASKAPASDASKYKAEIKKMNESADAKSGKDGVVMKKEQVSGDTEKNSTTINGLAVGSVVVALFIIAIIMLRRRRKQDEVA